MKSFCVLNGAFNKKLYEKIGASAFYVFGDRIGIAFADTADADKAVESLCDGVVSAGGTAENFGIVNESRLSFLIGNYSLSAAFFVGGESLVSVYSGNGRPLDANQEKMMAEVIASDDMPSGEKGVLIGVNSDYAYKRALLVAAQSLDGAAADVFCPDANLRSLIRSVMTLSGADRSPKPRFFISSSGFGISARDEAGKVLKRENLLDICCACRLEAGESLTVPFSASPSLETVAKAHGSVLKRSFEGGDESWQTDGVFLAVEVLRNMAIYGCGLSALAEKLTDCVTVRRNFFCNLSPDDVANLIPCDEILTDGSGSVYVRHNSGNVLLTRCRNLKSYCMEVSAADSETASELALEISSALLT